MPLGAKAVRAPWREAFLSQIKALKQPAFTLSSLQPVSPSQKSPDPTAFPPHQAIPRARTVIFRGMWANLESNPKNPANLNPNAYESDLPTITTDVRMDKVSELFGAPGDGRSSLSSMGGPVEAVFWFPDAMTQWRLRGNVVMIGPDIDSDDAASVRAALMPHMRQNQATNQVASWSWSRELTTQFGNLSPFMRGTFRNPPPGTPKSQSPGGGYALGQTVDDLEDGLARGNFRVLVIVPKEVDMVDLSNPEQAQRWNYKLEWSGNTGSWKETELWP